MNGATYSRPLGIAQLVRQHGDHWRIHGMSFASLIHDDRLMQSYVSLGPPESSDAIDHRRMRCYTKRIYSKPINEVRGRP